MTAHNDLLSTNQNFLLAALSGLDLERITPYLEQLTLRLGDVLYEAGDLQHYVYFPVSAIVSMHHELENGGSAEVANVGREGVLGFALFMGGQSTPSRAVVLAGGVVFRIRGEHLMQEFDRGTGLMKLLLRYSQALLTQVSQTAVCNRHHALDQQLSKWLLFTLDRLSNNELTMTQELIASMLGVRREGITEAAGKLQDQGYIRYRRGHITVLNRQGLEKNACECYQLVRAEFSRLLQDIHSKPRALNLRNQP